MSLYSDRPYRILIIDSSGSVSGSGKTNLLLNFKKNINDQTTFIYLRKIHLNQSINCLLKEKTKYELRN